MDAQRLSATPPGARAATHGGQSRRSHRCALTVSAHSLTTRARPVAVMVPVSRPWPGPEPSPARRCFPGRSPAGSAPEPQDGQFPAPVRSGSPAARLPYRSRSAVFVPGGPGRAGSRGSGSDARKRARNINSSGFTLLTHPGTTPETPTAESTCQESERVVV